MRIAKSTTKVLYLLTTIILLLIMAYGYTAGLAAPAKERIRVDGRELILGDEGDSIAGSHKSPKSKAKEMSAIEEFFQSDSRKITVAYTCITEKLLYDRIIPEFQEYWQDKTGEKVDFITGYALPDFDTLATSVSGQPVQVLIMSSSTNADNRGFAKTKWQDTANKGVLLSTPQVFLVRKGNPKHIYTYADLTRPGIRVMHVNPLSGTGSGLWQVCGIYGSALKESEAATGVKDTQAAYERLQQVENNAFYDIIQSPDAVKLFKQGAGDVLIISEFSALKAIKDNDSIELVLPPYTIINDLAVYKMDKNIGFTDEEVIEEFIDFLFSKETQEAVAAFRFRPSDPEVLAKHREFKKLTKSFKITYIDEQTDLKRDLILDTWLSINNNRSDKTYRDLAKR